MKVSGVQCCFYFFSIRGIFIFFSTCTLNYYFVIRNDFQKINLDWINHWMIQSELKKNVCKEFQCNVSLLNLKNKQVACFKVMSGFVIMTPEWKHTCFTFNILSCEQFSGLHKRDIIHMRNIHTWSCKKSWTKSMISYSQITKGYTWFILSNFTWTRRQPFSLQVLQC